MKVLNQPKGNVLVAVGPSTKDDNKMSNYALHKDSLRKRIDRNFRWQIGQLYGNVCRDLESTNFIYEGLKRPMHVKNNSDADKQKWAFVTNSKYDHRFEGDKFGTEGELSRVLAPARRVFVVLVSPNDSTEDYPNVDGWIEHWSWVKADPNDMKRPKEHFERYEACIFERK